MFQKGDCITIPSLIDYFKIHKMPITRKKSKTIQDTTEGFYYTVPPPNESVLVEYYFSVNNNYYNWTNPINTDEVFQFSIGRDMIVPDVYDLAPLPNLIDRSGVANVSVLATDNIGVDSVSTEPI